MSKEFRWSEGSQSFTFTFEAEKVTIHCYRAYSECYHSLYPENYAVFNKAIGQPAELAPSESIPAATLTPSSTKIHMAIENLAKVDFTWTDFDWDMEDD